MTKTLNVQIELLDGTAFGVWKVRTKSDRVSIAFRRAVQDTFQGAAMFRPNAGELVESTWQGRLIWSDGTLSTHVYRLSTF